MQQNGTGSVSDLRSDLANATDSAKGAGLVGFKRSGASAVGGGFMRS